VPVVQYTDSILRVCIGSHPRVLKAQPGPTARLTQPTGPKARGLPWHKHVVLHFTAARKLCGLPDWNLTLTQSLGNYLSTASQQVTGAGIGIWCSSRRLLRPREGTAGTEDVIKRKEVDEISQIDGKDEIGVITVIKVSTTPENDVGDISEIFHPSLLPRPRVN